MLVTKIVKSVTVILQLSPTDFVLKMCHQHRCNRFAAGFEITISIVHDYRARFSCTIFVHDRTIFSQSCTIFVPRLSCHDFHYFIDFSLEHIQFWKFFWSMNFLHHQKSLFGAKSVGFRSCRNLIFKKHKNKATMALMSYFQYEQLCF